MHILNKRDGFRISTLSPFFSLFVVLLLLPSPTFSFQKVVGSEKELARREQDSHYFQPSKTQLGASSLSEFGQCQVDYALSWSADMAVSIYSEPVSADVNADGEIEIVVAGFAGMLDVLEGDRGSSLAAFPVLFPKATTHSSPLLLDYDKDGRIDIVHTSYDGVITIVSASGLPFAGHSRVVPKLRLRKDWFQGLEGDIVEDVTPDNDDDPRMSTSNSAKYGREGRVEGVFQRLGARKHGDFHHGDADDTHQYMVEDDLFIDEVMDTHPDGDEDEDEDGKGEGAALQKGEKEVVENENVIGEEKKNEDEQKVEKEGKEAENGMEKEKEKEKERKGGDEHADEEHDAPLFHRRALLSDEDEHNSDQDRMDALLMLKTKATPHANDEIFQNPHIERSDAPLVSGEFIYVDSHVLATPVLSPVEGTDLARIIVPVSYYFDENQYASSSRSRKRLTEADIDTSYYVGAGIVSFVLDPLSPSTSSLSPEWSSHLDLTTDHTARRAYAFSSPVMGDVDGDGKEDVVFATGLGFVYALDAATGSTKVGWPFECGEMQGPPVIGDLDGDHKKEVIVTDALGNVIAIDGKTGEEKWHNRVDGYATQGVLLWDFDGDSLLEVVVITSDGHLWVFEGGEGKLREGFPYTLHSKVYAPARMVLVNVPDVGRQSFLLISAMDGMLYTVGMQRDEGGATTLCSSQLDYGENAFARPLVSDVDGDGKSEVVIATMNGNIFSFQTSYEVLSMDGSLVRLQIGREDMLESTMRRSRGDEAVIPIQIVDGRRGPLPPPLVEYNVKVRIGGPFGIIVHEETFSEAGDYFLPLSFSSLSDQNKKMKRELFMNVAQPQMFYIELKTERGDRAGVYATISFNFQFYRVVKYILLVPLFFVFISAIFAKAVSSGNLPT
uniref:Uncharacterized protein n=1 Tax=Palpitomonas bilix TaxID=652834 RepID=A0A7S3DAV6_9EUKA|mmetsp:Transcript_29251/g.75352  ORF Transcript_29251/g.75352 Transcript_29251/m.75352 type:complete len:895 (+) Transcript_29251:66-2750(+)